MVLLHGRAGFEVLTPAPHVVLANGQPLPVITANSTATRWWYDAANATRHVNTPRSATTKPITITQVGGRATNRAPSAAVDLTLNPATPLSLNPGQTVPVTATVTNAVPGAITAGSANLTAPAGWTITPGTPTGRPDQLGRAVRRGNVPSGQLERHRDHLHRARAERYRRRLARHAGNNGDGRREHGRRRVGQRVDPGHRLNFAPSAHQQHGAPSRVDAGEVIAG